MTILEPEKRPPSRARELATYLRELALARGPEAKLPTARELAHRFAISKTTVSVTLDLLESQHVISRKQGSGIYVSPKIHRKSICILFYSDVFHSGGGSPFWGIFWSLFAEEMERRLASHEVYMSFHLVIQARHDHGDLPEDIITMIELGNVHGVMAVGMDASTQEWLHQQGVPVVAFAGAGDYFVGLDAHHAIHLGVAQLVAQGCRSIGLWLPLVDFNSPEYLAELLAIYREALQHVGAAFDPRLVRYAPPLAGRPQATTEQEWGYQLATETFGPAQEGRPDGLFIPVDMITAGALVFFHQQHIVLGRDLHVATHANKGSPMFFGVEEALLLVEFDPAEMVQALFAQMDAVLAGHHPPTLLVKPVLRGKA